MKNLYILILIFSGSISYAQSVLTEQFEVSGNQAIQLQFDDASIIKVEGWNENYISIEASISINNNTQNDAYVFEETSENEVKKITGYLKDKEKLPRVIRIKKGGEIFTFNTDDWNSPEIQQFYVDQGEDGISWKSHGISWDIYLTIRVPKQHDIIISSKHGIIELNNLSGDIEANSIHGGVDLAVDSGMKSKINAMTKWGNIYSNVDINIDIKSSSDNKWNHIVASINGGNGNSIKLESKHANIYLRNK